MDTTFAELGLNERILTGVETLGFNTPTPILRVRRLALLRVNIKVNSRRMAADVSRLL